MSIGMLVVENELKMYSCKCSMHTAHQFRWTLIRLKTFKVFFMLYIEYLIGATCSMILMMKFHREIHLFKWTQFIYIIHAFFWVHMYPYPPTPHTEGTLPRVRIWAPLLKCVYSFVYTNMHTVSLPPQTHIHTATHINTHTWHTGTFCAIFDLYQSGNY